MIGEVPKAGVGIHFTSPPKPAFRITRHGHYPEEATEEAYSKKIDTSLKSLGLAYVDIYHHHNVWVRESALYEPILNALVKAKKSGKIRFIGITTDRNEPEVIQAAVDSKVYDVVLTAYNYRQKHAGEVKKAIARAAEAGLGIVAMKTIGGMSEDPTTRKKLMPKRLSNGFPQDPNVHTIIAGFTTFDQFELDLMVLNDITLLKSERENLRRATLRAGLYCQGCGSCLTQCVNQLPIPDLMRPKCTSTAT